MDLLNLFFEASLGVKICITSLIFISVFDLSLFLDKLIKFRSVHKISNDFEEQFWSGILMEDFYQKNKSKLTHPMGLIFKSAMQEWLLSDVSASGKGVELIKSGTRERIISALEISFMSIEEDLFANVRFLSTCASISPFVGLFGTVIGVIKMFSEVNVVNTSSGIFESMGSGVAESLISTAFGIVVAILCVIMHSIVVSQIGKILERLECFKCEMFSILSRELDAMSMKNFAEYSSSKRNNRK